MERLQFHWNDKPEIGTYKFCFGEKGEYDFYIDEVAVRYKCNGWNEREIEERFGECKFVLSGCRDGVAYINDEMKAQTIEEAKKEFEQWYEKYLEDGIKALENAIRVANNELASLRQKAFRLFVRMEGLEAVSN